MLQFSSAEGNARNVRVSDQVPGAGIGAGSKNDRRPVMQAAGRSTEY